MIQHQAQDVIKAEIAPADHADVKTLLDLCAQHDGLALAVNVDNLTHELGNGFLYYRGGQLIGVAFLFGEWTIEVIGAIHPAYRRQGVGRRLLDAIKNYCRKQAKEGLTIIGVGGWEAGKAFIHAAGGTYTLSEYHMELATTDIKRPAVWRDGLTLRQATPAQAAQVSGIAIQAFGDAEEEVAPWVAKAILKPARRFFLVTLDSGEAVGCISTVAEGDGQVDITAFGILPPFQGKGLGRQVLTQTVEMLLAEGWQRIGLDVETENSHALGLYQSCGFQQTRVDHYYQLQL